MLRLVLLGTPLSYHADEVFQYLEQAHRLVFGYGVVTWEYRYGMRSCLLPVLLSAPMTIGERLWPGTVAYLIIPRVCLCILSLGSIVAAYALGRRLSRTHALAAALAAAFWPDFLLFAGQALTDAIAVPFALGAAALLGTRRSRWKLIIAGALLAFATAIRFQYLLAFVALAAVSLRLRWRDWGWFTVGAAVALLAASLPDVAFGHAPYDWLVHNLHQNIGADRARAYGVNGPFFYAYEYLATWAIWMVPLLWLAWLGGRRYPELTAMAAVNIAVHSAIAHKEYRFILLSTMTIIVLAAIGTVEVMNHYGYHRYSRWIAACWGLAALTSVALPEQTSDWGRAVPGNQAFSTIGRMPQVCGVALWQQWWTAAEGYTYLHRPVPIYLPDKTPDPVQSLWHHQDAFNVILTTQRSGASLPGDYRLVQCFRRRPYNDDDACIWIRAGSCSPNGAESMEIERIVGEPDKPRLKNQ